MTDTIANAMAALAISVYALARLVFFLWQRRNGRDPDMLLAKMAKDTERAANAIELHAIESRQWRQALDRFVDSTAAEHREMLMTLARLNGKRSA